MFKNYKIIKLEKGILVSIRMTVPNTQLMSEKCSDLF